MNVLWGNMDLVIYPFVAIPVCDLTLTTDLCLSWPKVLNLVPVRGFMKTPAKELLEKYLHFFFH